MLLLQAYHYGKNYFTTRNVNDNYNCRDESFSTFTYQLKYKIIDDVENKVGDCVINKIIDNL